MCKLYVRLHLDYGDVSYDVPQKVGVSENYMMNRLKSVQYSAALAVTGAWRETSRDRLYSELGWESLGSGRWSRHLILFHKFINNLTPAYTKNPITLFAPISYSIRNPPVLKHITSRTESFNSSFYPDSLSEWNKLDPAKRESSSVNVFKKKLFSTMRPPSNFV